MSKIISEIVISDSKKLVFSIENLHGIDYDSVRVWTNTPTFNGPTLSGFILDKEKTARLINIISNVSKRDIEMTKTNKLLEKIPLNSNKSLHVSLQVFKNKSKLDIREFISSGTFEGYTRRGVSIYSEHFQAFVQDLNKLFVSIPEKQQGKLFEDENIDTKISLAESKNDSSPQPEIPSETEEVAAEIIKIPKKKDIKNESLFSRLFQYYWYIHKYKTGFSDLTDLNKLVDYYDLSEYLGEERLFTGGKEEITFKQPEKKKKDKEEEEENLEEETFEKLKKLFLAYQENSYERELVFGFPYIFYRDEENDKTIATPLFLAPCTINYDTSTNTIKLSLSKDDVELNIAAIDEFLGEEGKDYVREELMKNKPHIPFEQKEYKEFLVLANNLLEWKLNRDTLPSSFELDSTPYKEFLKEDKVVKVSNKAFLLLTRKSNFYVLSDLEKLVSLGDDVANSILTKFFDPEDTGMSDDNDGSRVNFEFKEYLFPFPSNHDQRRIVDALSNDLILVQGPPGTGKSQTISNLICHLVANGKTVLVSSQKNKALEVIDEKILNSNLNYLQMTLLKNDTEAKKELIDKINDLDYYIKDKTSYEYQSKIKECKDRYSQIDGDIASLTQVFEETKEAIQNNESLFRQFSKVKHFNLIEDDVPFLNTSNTKTYRDDLFELIKLLKQLLPDEKEIREFIKATSCSEKNISEIIYLLKNFISVRQERTKKYKKTEFRILKKLLPKEQLSINSALYKSSELFTVSKSYDTFYKALSAKAIKQIEDLVQEMTIQEIQEQENKLKIIKDNLENIRQLRDFNDLVKTDDPTEIASLLKLVQDIKGTTGLYRKLAEILSFIKKFPHKKILSKKAFSKLHKQYMLEDIEKSCLYRQSEITINRTLRGFCFKETVQGYLETAEMPALEFAQRLDNMLGLLKSIKFIGMTLTSTFGVISPLQDIILQFKSATIFASALNNFYVYQNLCLSEKSIARELNPHLKGEHKIISLLIDEEDNLEIKTLEKILELSQKTRLFLKALSIEENLPKFHRTIDSIKESIRAKTKFVKDFETNIDNVFACEMLDNEIKQFEKQYPSTTDEIINKIAKLKDKKVNTINQIIQNSIDLNLLNNYGYSKSTQRDIAHFRRQIRRSKKSYKTFEELKEEFNFEALLKVFPCWIMSIEDVARVFPLKAGLFDYVIIDEASQCSLPTSIPTLFRGKKAIVVGDDKQLSDFTKNWIPTTLNETLIRNLRLRAFKKFDSLDAKANSLFDSCSVFREAPILLTEHFRSYPEIINFSNQRFYGSKLRIMTNSLNNQLGTILNVIKVDGAAENELKVNPKEATEVISHLKKLMRDSKYENLSLGVLSLFREQASLIRKMMYDDDFIRERIKKHKLVADTVDGFQGDEKDVILYSFRYAPNSSPHIFTFTRGEDGWRRANVGFTRARKQIFCFTSRPVEKFPAGLIKEFLQYAQSSTKEIINEGLFGSDFEKDMYQFLSRDKKLVVIPQFATCGFFIDFVLLKNGKTLALECDGMQHYTETGELIEPDIERQDILWRAGWTMKRVSSKEFYRDSQRAVNAILSYFN